MKILRDGTEVGEVNAKAQLRSADPDLIELWNKWQTDGFQVLGPPEQEPPEGVHADKLYTFKPAPDNLGLVAFEFIKAGYEISVSEVADALLLRDI
jgi:hypothetical protein